MRADVHLFKMLRVGKLKYSTLCPSWMDSPWAASRAMPTSCGAGCGSKKGRAADIFAFYSPRQSIARWHGGSQPEAQAADKQRFGRYGYRETVANAKRPCRETLSSVRAGCDRLRCESPTEARRH